MNRESLPDLILLTGSTGSGKTQLLANLDSNLFEAVSFDSRQIYSDLPIGTTAPTTTELERMPHHLVGILSSNEDMDANRYRKLAGEAVQKIIDKKKIPILTAGTGFYLRAFLYGMYPVPKIPADVRNHVNSLSEGMVLEELEKMDSIAKEEISPNDFYRYRRALEVAYMGVKWSDLKTKTDGGYLTENPGIRVRGFFLDWNRNELYERINRRAESLLIPMAQEARKISERYGRNCPGLKTLGYNFALDYIDGSLNIESFCEEIAKAHRNYAKRQITWFRKQPLLESFSWDCVLGILADMQLLTK